MDLIMILVIFTLHMVATNRVLLCPVPKCWLNDTMMNLAKIQAKCQMFQPAKGQHQCQQGHGVGGGHNAQKLQGGTDGGRLTAPGTTVLAEHEH